jgi:hypothetical protein
MGRRKSVAQLQRMLTYAEKRATYVPPAKEPGTGVTRRPKISVDYIILSPFEKPGTTLTIQASDTALRFFGDGSDEAGLGILGLVAGTVFPGAPRGFKPARIGATVGTNSPVNVTSTITGRVYPRYTAGTKGDKAQHSYMAPVNATAEAGLATRVKTVFTEVEPRLGGAFGRIWFEPERMLTTGSGLGTGGAAP